MRMKDLASVPSRTAWRGRLRAKDRGDPGTGRLLTALGAFDGVGEAGAQARGVWHGDPPPGTHAVARRVFIVVL